MVLIDTNRYLDLYRVTKGRKLLDALTELREYIFVTVQLVEEVQRNKLQVAAAFLSSQLQQLRASEIPDHLFDLSKESAARLPQKLREISSKVAEANAELEEVAVRTLQQISWSEDEVSKAFTILFKKMIKHTPEELQRARERKERGNPPGKKTDPLGDQLIWEQLISHFKGQSRLWIISKDRDYCTSYGENMWLNPFLYQDLAGISESAPEVYCFDSIGDGLAHFVNTTGVRAEKLPTAEESKEIKKEFDSLPPFEGVYSGTNATYYAAIENAWRQQQHRVAIFYSTLGTQDVLGPLPLRAEKVSEEKADEQKESK